MVQIDGAYCMVLLLECLSQILHYLFDPIDGGIMRSIKEFESGICSVLVLGHIETHKSISFNFDSSRLQRSLSMKDVKYYSFFV